MTRLNTFVDGADFNTPIRQVGGAGLDPRGAFLALVGVDVHISGGGNHNGDLDVLEADAARWLYPWVRVRLGNGPLFRLVRDDSLSSVTVGLKALNIAEISNTAKVGTSVWYVSDVQSNPTTPGSTYPSGFAPKPIGWGRAVVVRMWFERSTSDGSAKIYQPVFDVRNSHDGTCAS